MFISQEWLDLERDVLGMRPLITGSVEEVRKAYNETSESLAKQYPGEDTYNVVDHREVTDSGIAIRVYTPVEDDIGKLFPVGIFAHGGGHVSGGAWESSFEDRMCRYLSQHARVIIAQVDFRRAPEHPIPAQIDDCTEAYKWCHSNYTKLRGDPNRFFAIGSSLGGGTAVGVALKLIDENLEDLVKGVVALVPALVHPLFVPHEYREMFTSYEEMQTGAPIQDGESMMLFYGHNGGNKQRTNPYAFPCLHPGLQNLPPVYQAICELDPVRDDSTIFKFILDKHGVPNKADFYAGLPHYFWLFPQLASSLPFHDNVAKGVRWVVSLMR